MEPLGIPVPGSENTAWSRSVLGHPSHWPPPCSGISESSMSLLDSTQCQQVALVTLLPIPALCSTAGRQESHTRGLTHPTHKTPHLSPSDSAHQTRSPACPGGASACHCLRHPAGNNSNDNHIRRVVLTAPPGQGHHVPWCLGSL